MQLGAYSARDRRIGAEGTKKKEKKKKRNWWRQMELSWAKSIVVELFGTCYNKSNPFLNNEKRHFLFYFFILLIVTIMLRISFILEALNIYQKLIFFLLVLFEF